MSLCAYESISILLEPDHVAICRMGCFGFGGIGEGDVELGDEWAKGRSEVVHDKVAT